MTSFIKSATVAGLIALAPGLALAGPHSLPVNAPIMSVTIPDGWQVVKRNQTIEASPRNEEVYVSFMMVSMGEFGRAIKTWEEWSSRSKVKLDASSKSVQKFQFHGRDSISETWRGTDREGPTTVMRTILKLSDSKLLFVTEWGADSAAQKYASEIQTIRTSVTKLR
jgi:hypothetical protein